MKKLRRGAALLMAAATLSSLPAIPFAMPAPVIAQAVSQTRVFRFDFGSFAALYDTRGEKWYDESGELLKSQTEAVQVWKRGSLTVDFENKEAYILKTDGTKKTNAAVTDFLQNTLSAFVPDYASEYYDKAQQKNVSVPKPDAFPLTYRVLPDTDVFTVEVLIGENSLGCFTGGDDILYSGDGAVGYGRPDAFTDAGDLTVDGNISIADAIYSSRVAAEDTDMKISALGLELADEDGDGMVGIGDVRALLDELVSPILPSRAYMTQVSEIYAHEVLRDQYTKEEMSVILTDGGETWVDCYRTLNGNLDETARHHGYEDADQMLHELHEDPYAVSSLEPMDDFQRSLVASYEGSRTLHFLADCEAGEEYDKWYLSIIDDEQNYQYMEIKGIDITDAGLLKVDWIGLENSAVPTEHYKSFTHILTVKHGLWDAVKGKTFGYEDYTAMEEAEFAAMVGQLLTVTRSESTTQPPLKENQIPVLSDTRERIEWCPHGDVFYAQTDEYKNWAGKEDFELALSNIYMDFEDSITGERVAVLAKDDELKIYSVFNGKPEDHRLDWLKLRFDGVLDVSNIIDRRGSYKDQYDCISELQTIFVDTLKLPKNSLKADRIKSVSRYQPWSLYMDIDTAVAETFGIPWDESMGEFPYELRITVSGTNDYSQQTESSLKKKQIPADAYMMKKTDIYNNGYAYTAKDYEADVKEIREKGLLAPNDDRYGVVLKRGKGDDPDKLAMILPATVYTGLLWYISEL